MTRIERIETTLVDIPTIRGHVLSMTTMRSQAIVLVRIRFSDGSEGLGEGTTIGGMSYGPESPEGIKLTIDSYIAPLLAGQPADDVNAAILLVEKNVRGNPIARCAVEIALWDGLAKRLGTSVAQVFGGAVRTQMPVAWTLASGRSDTDITEAEEMIAKRRHNIFKLKIGKRSVAEDLAHVGAIARALGGRASIRVDVNQAWSLTDARRGLAGLQDIGCELAEQPIRTGDLAALRALTDGTQVAIMADEQLNGPASALTVAAARAADVFAVKIGQSGGLRRAREVCAIGEAAGIGLYGGTMLEAGISTAAAIQLFATVPQLAWGTELFGPLLLTDEILAEPLIYRDFSVQLPEGPGIGVALDDSKVDFYRRDRARSLHAVS